MDIIEKGILEIMGDARMKTGRIDEYKIPKCEKCGGPKLMNIEMPFGDRIVTIMCHCERVEYEAKQAELEAAEKAKQTDRLRMIAIPDESNRVSIFDKDDGSNKAISGVCRRYVENWAQMKADNIGIIFHGSVGTGKTFLASCIANALVDKGVSVLMTTFPRIINQLQATFKGRDEYLRDITGKSLLIIDDLGVERDTPYAMEQVFSVIDSRLRANLPLIITTNLSMTDMKSPPTMAFGRIYDRVLEMCSIPLKLDGQSKRVGNMNDKRDAARRIFGLNGQRVAGGEEEHDQVQT